MKPQVAWLVDQRSHAARNSDEGLGKAHIDDFREVGADYGTRESVANVCPVSMHRTGIKQLAPHSIILGTMARKHEGDSFHDGLGMSGAPQPIVAHDGS